MVFCSLIVLNNFEKKLEKCNLKVFLITKGRRSELRFFLEKSGKNIKVKTSKNNKMLSGQIY